MDTALVWVIIGLLLILTELLATSIIAVFFGIAAVIVGLLLWAGLIEATWLQFVIFGVLSLVLLFTARRKLRSYLVGDLADNNSKQQSFQQNMGERASAVSDFHQGLGRVLLNGVQWSAQSSQPDEAIQAGDTVWIVANDGIQLTVSKTRSIPPQQG
jgi:membrane protein implicated in regulation of membrane protease activity